MNEEAKPAKTATAASGPSGVGGRRVIHFGNAVLSIAVFFLTLMLALLALDPTTSRHFLSERHRTPDINESGTELMNGCTPLVVELNGTTVLVVPAISSEVQRTSQWVDHFFTGQMFVVGGASWHFSSVSHHVAPTLSDVVILLLERSLANATPTTTATTTAATRSGRRHRNVLHLCSAQSCATPFALQQWSNRGTAATALRAAAHEASSSSSPQWRRVHNFALVFGPVSEADVMRRELKEHGVMVSHTSKASSDEVVMPLVGSVGGDVVLAACSEVPKGCRTSTLLRDAAVTMRLHEQVDALSTPAAKARVFAEWNAVRLDKAGASPTEVRQLAFASVAFGQRYALPAVPIDLVYVDVGASESVAAVAYLHGLATAHGEEGVTLPLLPQSVVVSLYASEWVEEVLAAIEELQRTRHYAVVPLMDLRRPGWYAEGWTDFSTWRQSQKAWLAADDYTSSFFRHSSPRRMPLLVVVLTLQFTTVEAFDAALKVSAVPMTVHPPERFFYNSLNVTAADDSALNAFFDVAGDAFDDARGAGFADGMVDSLVRFAVQYVYFLIPLTMAGVLVWSLCRPRRSR